MPPGTVGGAQIFCLECMHTSHGNPAIGNVGKLSKQVEVAAEFRTKCSGLMVHKGKHIRSCSSPIFSVLNLHLSGLCDINPLNLQH